MLQEVPKATVVLVNPAHVAVALRYESKTMDTPMVVAKGADYLCEKIREIAQIKMKDLNTSDLEKAVGIIEGTARSMGIESE